MSAYTWSVVSSPFDPGDTSQGKCSCIIYLPEFTTWIAGGVSSDGTIALATSPDIVSTVFSSQGNPWYIDDPTLQPFCKSLAYSPSLERVVAIGMPADGKTTLTNTIYTSDDGGITWVGQGSPQGSGDYSVLWDVAWSPDQNQFVAVGSNEGNVGCTAIVTSPDGITWTQQSSDIDFWDDTLYGGFSPNRLRCVCWSPGQSAWFAGGLNPTTVPNQTSIYTSVDGETWTPVSTQWDAANFTDLTGGGSSFDVSAIADFPELSVVTVCTGGDGDGSSGIANTPLTASTGDGGTTWTPGDVMSGSIEGGSIEGGSLEGVIPLVDAEGISFIGVINADGGEKSQVYSSPDFDTWTEEFSITWGTDAVGAIGGTYSPDLNQLAIGGGYGGFSTSIWYGYIPPPPPVSVPCFRNIIKLN